MSKLVEFVLKSDNKIYLFLGGDISGVNVPRVYKRIVRDTDKREYKECIIDVTGVEYMSLRATDMFEKYRKNYLSDDTKIVFRRVWGETAQLLTDAKEKGLMKIDNLIYHELEHQKRA